MACTKTSARKNAYLYSPSSTSISRLPSPLATSFDTTFSNCLSSSPKSNPNPINPNPMSIVLPPLYTCPPPNLAQVPPHLRTPTLNPTTTKRRSMCVQEGIGTSKAPNTKPSLFIISNSKTDESSETPPHTTPTKPITPPSIHQQYSSDPLPTVATSFSILPSVCTSPIPLTTTFATITLPSTHLPTPSPKVEPSNTDIMASLQTIMARQLQ
uniref:Mucin-2-like n=1 Tax=Cicer arietinum TaxID=3827 RepID=A0A1S3EGR1_CICAR|nr:mucin-2-like [Cicer arietinum]